MGMCSKQGDEKKQYKNSKHIHSFQTYEIEKISQRITKFFFGFFFVYKFRRFQQILLLFFFIVVWTLSFIGILTFRHFLILNFISKHIFLSMPSINGYTEFDINLDTHIITTYFLLYSLYSVCALMCTLDKFVVDQIM